MSEATVSIVESVQAAAPWLVGALWATPWALAVVVFLARIRLPRPLPPLDIPLDRHHELVAGAATPRVSVIVPARNEARNIERVVASLAQSQGVPFEVIVVDDRSDDDTAARARRVATAGAERIEVIDGAELPEGWLGKNWACHQGATQARGDILLFTDADTVHAPDLLARALAALEADRADALTLAGRQLMLSFWECLVQPQIFMGILSRYPDTRRTLAPHQWRDAIANGQYIMVRREAYEAIGGHEALRAEVVEDMRFAQRLVRLGHRLSLRAAEDAFATRMYTSLGELVEGWSKNILLGGLATLPEGWVRRVAPLAAVVLGTVSLLLPPLLVLGGLMGAVLMGTVLTGAAAPWFGWAAAMTLLGVLFWALVSWRMRISPLWGLLYPLGAAVAQYIFLRTWWRGGHVEWKGRCYELDLDAVTRDPGVA